MTLQGSPLYPYIPARSTLGSFLVSLDQVDPQLRQPLLDLSAQMEQRIKDVEDAVRNAFYQVNQHAAGFVQCVGISGSTQQALNFAKVGFPVGGSTQFTWTFQATEPDTLYGILYALSGRPDPAGIPTIVKSNGWVQMQFNAVTPAGLQADLVLVR